MKKGIYDRKSLLTFKEIAERGKQYTLFSYGDGPIWDVYTGAFLFRHNADVSVDIIETFGDVIEKLNNNGRVIEDIILGLGDLFVTRECKNSEYSSLRLKISAV